MQTDLTGDRQELPSSQLPLRLRIIFSWEYLVSGSKLSVPIKFVAAEGGFFLEPLPFFSDIETDQEDELRNGFKTEILTTQSQSRQRDFRYIDKNNIHALQANGDA